MIPPAPARRAARLAALSALSLLLAACASPGSIGDGLAEPAELVEPTHASRQLETLPPPARPVDVAVYRFEDRTGQNKPSDNFAQFSRAVTQGADAILVDALLRAGDGRWFNAVERASLQNLLQERNIIEQTRQRYLGGTGDLQALRFAGMLIEGGIINYDSNETTGGLGARYLGIGANTRYNRDVVTVALRAVSVTTGEILVSVMTTKTIYSSLLQGSVFRFVALDELLETEAGYTRNEPVGLAVRQAIELAVYALVLEGAREGLWRFADRDAAADLIADFEERYKRSFYGAGSADEIAMAAPAAP